jgi:hypothetical protein
VPGCGAVRGPGPVAMGAERSCVPPSSAACGVCWWARAQLLGPWSPAVMVGHGRHTRGVVHAGLRWAHCLAER